MKVKAWGTRGSIAVANSRSVKAGGNTTCYEIKSECLPSGIHLMVDAGTGFVPAGCSYLNEIASGNLRYVLLFTHYHWDHTQGLTLAPPTFIEQVPMDLYGPVDEGFGPEEMVKYMFRRPFFPVDAKGVIHKMKFKALDAFDVHVILIHPKGGLTNVTLDNYKKTLSSKRQFVFDGKRYPVEDCLVIRMAKTHHGNANCVSYRFEENPTGKVFVLCTDHEDMVSLSTDIRAHLANADLAVMDAQYDQARYMTRTGNYGHGTPYGAVKHAAVCGVKRLGMTHHDPGSVDDYLEGKILQEAGEALGKIINDNELLVTYGVGEISLKAENIFLCLDYMEMDV